MTQAEQNKQTVIRLLGDAMLHNDVDFVRRMVTKEAVTHRAGFAALYKVLNGSIPPKGNFLEWMEQGWAILHATFSEQAFEIKEIVSEGNRVIITYHLSATHNSEFLGIPATGKRVGWDEVGVFTFNDEGKITDLWFMCEEVKLADDIGLKITP